MSYCEENGHEIVSGACINCNKVMRDTAYYIEYETVIKDEPNQKRNDMRT